MPKWRCELGNGKYGSFTCGVGLLHSLDRDIGVMFLSRTVWRQTVEPEVTLDACLSRR